MKALLARSPVAAAVGVTPRGTAASDGTRRLYRRLPPLLTSESAFPSPVYVATYPVTDQSLSQNHSALLAHVCIFFSFFLNESITRLSSHCEIVRHARPQRPIRSRRSGRTRHRPRADGFLCRGPTGRWRKVRPAGRPRCQGGLTVGIPSLGPWSEAPSGARDQSGNEQLELNLLPPSTVPAANI